MRFHVRESHGKYFLADEQWSRMYTMGALAVPEPVASFSRKEDAEAFLALKNRNGPPVDITRTALECLKDCRFATGFDNEGTCDTCIRKGNIRDYYVPEPTAPRKGKEGKQHG